MNTSIHRNTSSSPLTKRALGGLAATLLLAVTLPAIPASAATDPCAAPANPVACENSKPGAPSSQWSVEGSGSTTIQGFTTDISVNHGSTVHFKIKTDASAYRLDIYRMGYYGGRGARLITSISPTATLPQTQPACLTDSTTRLVDCGNWAESASWNVPADEVSGVHFANLVRTDATAGVSQVFFVVRADGSTSKILYQTSDTTWQAYNRYGGYSLYFGSPTRAYKVSYNRPFITRDCCDESFIFSAEYPMIRWLEANGYDVSYASGIDTDRRGAELLNHKTFMSSGHDEYWSRGQRDNVEAARNAGVNLAFFSGNEMYWKTRWEPSIAPSADSYRTLVTYKETNANAKIDPNPAWTGTWRDPRFSPPSDGGRPENAVTGNLFMVNCCSSSAEQDYAITVPYAYSKYRIWRNTSVASLTSGSVATFSAGTLGYEWDEDVDNGARPAGAVQLSSTTKDVTAHLVDYGNTFVAGSATHHLTMYRASSGALVFGAGTIRWSWGLDDQHDLPASVVDQRMQQATVNILADMGAQPATLQPGLIAATASSDTVAPTATVVSPIDGNTALADKPVTISGTAADSGGVVGGVEVSTDGGGTWHPAQGADQWTYQWTPTAGGTATIVARATDDSGNIGAVTPGRTVTVLRQCPCSIWNTAPVPAVAANTDATANEVGVKFQTAVSGYISGIRFYKGTPNTGTHVGHLWSRTGTSLGSVTFSSETASGWQQANFASPINVAANTTYVASYYAPVGRYAVDVNYFATAGVNASPLKGLASGVDGNNGVYRYGSSGFPTTSYKSSNYWVDVVFNTAAPSAPIGVSATAASASSITVGWTDAANESATRVERSADGATGWTAVATVGQNITSVTDTGLLPSTTYYYRAIATNSGGESAPSATVSATTSAAPPATPSGLRTLPVSATQINLSWTGVPSQLGYRLERSPDSTTWASIGTTAGTTLSDTGLTAATTYYYRVSAYNSGGSSAPSDPVPGTTLTATNPPAAPTGLVATSTSTQVSLTWNDVAAESGYIVQRSMDGSTGWVTRDTTAANVVTYVDASDVSPSTRYYYRIIATNAGGNSDPSNVVSITTQPEPPLAPTGAAAVAASSSRIDVSWNASAGASGYRVDRSLNGLTGWSAAGTTAAGTTSLADTGLVSGTTYYYRVIATNSGGDSTPSTVVSATTVATAPLAPTGLVAVGSSASRIDLSWTASSGATGYRVERSADGSTGWSAIGTSTVTSYGDTGLTAGTTYYYRVVATNSTGSSPPSAVVSAQTTPNPPAAPTSVAATVFSPTRVDVTWSDVSGATGYRVERSPDGSTGWSLLGTPASGVGLFSDLGVTAGGTYFYRVLATNSGGTSAPSSVVSVTLAPPTPTGVTATAFSQSRIDVSWATATGTTVYRVERSADGSTGWALVATPNATSYSDTGLSPATTYYYRITATNTGGASPTSAVVSATTNSIGLAAPPSNVAATVVPPSQVDVTWDDSTGATGYRVERSLDGTSSWTSVGTTSFGTTVVSDTTVSAGGTYYYRVIATNGAGSSAPSAVVSATLAPSAPTGLTGAASSPTQIGLSWSASPGATGYRVERSPDGSTGWSAVGTPTVTSFSDTGLNPSSTYYYRVVATNSGGSSPPSAVVSVTLTPPAPTGVTATAVNQTRVDVTWTDVSGATGYRVERSPDGSTGWSLVGTAGSGVGFVSDLGVTPGGTYFYRVLATNSGGTSPSSSVVSVTLAPPAPTGVNATAISSSRIDVSWGSATGATGYRVERSADGSTGWSSVATPNATSYSDTGLSAGATFYYRITATNSGGGSPTSAVAFATTLSGLPSPATGLRATNVLATSADLSWTDAAGESGYRIERSADGSTGWASVGTVAANVTAWSDSGLTPATTYFYRVIATNAAGDAAPSNVLALTTLPNPAGTPTGLTASTVSTSRIDLSWTATPDATGYRLERSLDGSTAWSPIAQPAVTSYSDTGLAPGTTYYYRVVATNAGGDSPPSAVASAATLPLAPNAPTGVAAAAASSSEIDVRWKLSSDATSYRLEVSTTGTSPWTLLATLGGSVGTYAHTALPPSTTYYYRVTAANTGGSSTPSATASATTVTRGCPCSIWAATATPTVLATGDASANELGLKFRTDVSGVVTGIRFYKGSTNTGTHVGHLWSRTGTVLATATFTNETATGWQQVLFSSPVTVTAGTTYVASYYAPSGHYSVNNDFFVTTGVTNAPLTALAAGVDGVNGVYRSASSGFPNSSYRSSNYWVDVVFTPTTPLAPTSPTVTGVTSSSVSISWPDLSTENSYRVERSTDGVNGWTLVASTSQNVTTYSDVALPASTTFYYRVLAINGGGTSPPSPSVAATTAASP